MAQHNHSHHHDHSHSHEEHSHSDGHHHGHSHSQSHNHSHSHAAVDVPDSTGIIHPFLTTQKSVIQCISRELTSILSSKEAKKILGYAGLNLVCTVLLLIWCNSTNSMALTAYTYLTIFDIFSLMTCLVSIWVRKQQQSPVFSFGYGRFEVLSVFASTILAQLGSFFIIKESIERMVEQPEIHTGRLLVGTGLAFTFHMLVTYSMENTAFSHVTDASSSSWLQEHVSDISESICYVVPGLSKLLLPRINPLALVAFAGGFSLLVVYVLIDVKNYYSVDTWVALLIAMMTSGTMFPMSVYCGKILLQTTPSHMIGQLDKCIREASTLDGVLEFRSEHFWTLDFNKMAGSVHVRIRRDADEQMVLAHVYHRLNNLVPLLTVHVFKDDWMRGSSYQLGDMSKYQTSLANNQTRSLNASHDGSFSKYGTSKPPIFPNVLQNNFNNISQNSSSSFNNSVSPDVSLTSNNSKIGVLPEVEGATYGGSLNLSTNSNSQFANSSAQRPSVNNYDMYMYAGGGSINLSTTPSVGMGVKSNSSNKTVYDLGASGLGLYGQTHLQDSTSLRPASNSATKLS